MVMHLVIVLMKSKLAVLVIDQFCEEDPSSTALLAFSLYTVNKTEQDKVDFYRMILRYFLLILKLLN